MKNKLNTGLIALGTCFLLSRVAPADEPPSSDVGNAPASSGSAIMEIVIVVIVATFIAGFMASNRSDEMTETHFTDIWNRPFGKSYSYHSASKRPSTPKEILATLIVLVVIYLTLRLTIFRNL